MDKSVLVTGASRGIGRAVALRLAQDRYDIAVHCHSNREAALDTLKAVQALGATGRVLAFDIRDRAATADALAADIETHGAYYGVVCNAGIARDGAFPALSGEDWDQVLGTNLDGFYNVLNPLPVLTAVNPGTTAAGCGAFTLTLAGSGFVSSSVARWQGSPLVKTFVSGTRLRAAVPVRP